MEIVKIRPAFKEFATCRDCNSVNTKIEAHIENDIKERQIRGTLVKCRDCGAIYFYDILAPNHGWDEQAKKFDFEHEAMKKAAETKHVETEQEKETATAKAQVLAERNEELSKQLAQASNTIRELNCEIKKWKSQEIEKEKAAQEKADQAGGL